VTHRRLFVGASVLLAWSVCGGVADAQRSSGTPEELTKKRDEKLKLPFLSKAGWITDWDKARADAKKNEKLIFAYFTRSYAK
jgi:hypothetical protein